MNDSGTSLELLSPHVLVHFLGFLFFYVFLASLGASPSLDPVSRGA